MKLFNIHDTESFYKAVDSCVGPVLVTSSDGRTEDFRHNELLRGILENAATDGVISSIELRLSRPEDVNRMISFMAGFYTSPMMEKKSA